MMKKSLGFVLFCTTGFCTGYLAGIPFFKSSLGVSETPARSDAKPIQEHRGDFVSLVSRKSEPHEAQKTVKSTKPESSSLSSAARRVEKLTLPEVQARLEAMNGMLATAETDELEQNLVAAGRSSIRLARLSLPPMRLPRAAIPVFCKRPPPLGQKPTPLVRRNGRRPSTLHWRGIRRWDRFLAHGPRAIPPKLPARSPHSRWDRLRQSQHPPLLKISPSET